MLVKLDECGIKDLVESDSRISQVDADELGHILTELESRSDNGLVILYNPADTDSCALFVEDIPYNMDIINIYDDNGWLTLDVIENGDSKTYKVCFTPTDEEKIKKFIKFGLNELVEEELDYGDYGDDGEEIVIDQLYNDGVINNPDNMNDFGISKEGIQFLEPANINNYGESLTEATLKVENKPALQSELDKIIPLADEYGFEYFTAMPFVNFDNDEQSIEYQYPNFFKVCKSFFKEMGLIDHQDIDNIDVLEENWYNNIFQQDWDTILDVCKILINKEPKGNKDSVTKQVEKVYKNHSNDGLDESLNEEEDLDESLTEEKNSDKLRRYLKSKDESLTEDTDESDEDFDDELAKVLLDDKINSKIFEEVEMKTDKEKRDEFFRKMASLEPEEPILKEDLDNYYTNALNATSVLYNIGVDELREELLSHEN